jgi:hypothetical protein
LSKVKIYNNVVYIIIHLVPNTIHSNYHLKGKILGHIYGYLWVRIKNEEVKGITMVGGRLAMLTDFIRGRDFP